MKIVAIRDMSAGNAEVGDMWQETAIFDGDTQLVEVIRWAATFSDEKTLSKSPSDRLHRRITLTVPHGEDFPRHDFVMPNQKHEVRDE